MILSWLGSFLSGIYFSFVEWCLRRMLAPVAIQILRQRNNPSTSLMIFFGAVTPKDRKLIEIKLNRYKKFFFGRWHLFFESDLPLLQQTMNLFWVKTESHFLKRWGAMPSRTEDENIEAAVFLFQRLRLDYPKLKKKSWLLRGRWEKFFNLAKVESSEEHPILQTVLGEMAHVLGMDKAEELQFAEHHEKILRGEFANIQPWTLAPVLKSMPDVWCWWLPQFPYDWAELPKWTPVERKILFSTARWEMSRGLLQDWQHTGFADELKRLQLFFEKAFPQDTTSEYSVTQHQLEEAQKILNAKNASLMAPS
jgi:hypothetical protein